MERSPPKAKLCSVSSSSIDRATASADQDMAVDQNEDSRCVVARKVQQSLCLVCRVVYCTLYAPLAGLCTRG